MYDSSVPRAVWDVHFRGGMNQWSAPDDWSPVIDEVLAKMISGEPDAAAHQAALDGVSQVIREWLLA